MFIIFVMALHWGVNVEMAHQDAAGASVLGQDKVDLLEHLDGAEGHVVEVANRSRHYEKFTCHVVYFL